MCYILWKFIRFFISGDSTLQSGDDKIRLNTWKYKWVGTNQQRDCGIEIQSTVDEDSGVWSYVHEGGQLNVNVTLLGTKLKRILITY